jgi:hypothetical protein
MLKSIAVAGIIFAAASGSAFAQSNCSEPLAPTAPPSKPNLKQISDSSHDANQFMKQSDDYQECLKQELAQKTARAAKDKKQLDQSVADTIQSEIDRNQQMKQQVGDEFKTAFLNFCRSNPNADPSCKKLVSQQ